MWPHQGPVLPPASQLASHWLPGRRASANQRPGRVGQGRAELLLTVAGGKQSGTEACWCWQVAGPTSQHALLQPRPSGGLACLPKSQSLKSVPEFVFLHKRFSAWATAAASLLLLYLYHLNGSFTFEYLDLCQSLANIWEGNKAGSQCSEIDKMSKNVEGMLLMNQTHEIPWYFLHSFFVRTCITN